MGQSKLRASGGEHSKLKSQGIAREEKLERVLVPEKLLVRGNNSQNLVIKSIKFQIKVKK